MTLRSGQASEAVGELGWRVVLDTLRTSVAVASLDESISVAARVVAATAGDDHLSLDVRPARLELALQSPGVTEHDVALAIEISRTVGALGLRTAPFESPRSVQVLAIGIDALEIDSIRPFWRAVLGYLDAPDGSLYDPVAQGPAIWFQQMDQPRPQRNRLHFDVSVPHDQAQSRIQATLSAGGTLLSDAEAPAFWVLADPEGNEACVTTWQGRERS